MEYLGFLPLGVAVAGVSLRCYFLMKEKPVRQADAEQHLSPRARRVQEATIARRLLGYHRGFLRA